MTSKTRHNLRIPSLNSYSSASLSSLNTPLSETCERLTPSPRWRSKCSPAVSLEDLLSSGSISPIIDRNGRVRRTVNEALDACIWLKSAGFPQYVQKFEAREFPMNLSKLQVEKDHCFLDGPATDTLIKRLNVLNRCADLLEEILEKQNNVDSDDEDDLRAISDHWHKSVEGKWSRKVAASNGDIVDDVESETDPSLMVTELSNSPTRNVPGTVKTYTHSPTCSISSQQRTGSLPSTSSHTRKPLLVLECPSEDRGDESTSRGGGVDEDLDFLGSFASGILDKFETTLANLGNGDSLSRSLPNVFSAANGLDVDHSRFSVVSDASVESSKDEFLTDDELTSPTVRSSCGRKGKGLSNWRGSPHLRGQFEDGSPGVEDTPSRGSPTPSQSSTSRRNTLDSIETGSLHEVFELLATPSPQPIKAKWHSFHRQHSFRRVFKPVRALIPIEELSVGQISVLRKLSLIKLTALIDLHNGKANVSRILKVKRNKQHLKSSKGVFGSSLACNIAKYGTALPPVIIRAMNYIRMEGMETVGLFRRTAAKSSIESLKEEIELNQDSVDFSDYTNYQVADAIKLFFRELPEPLLMGKLSEALIACYDCIPEEVRLQALQSVVLLLPDENREALHCLLYFLKYISFHSKVHQMDATNLGLCLSPSLFALSCSSPRPGGLSRRGSFRKSHAVTSTANLSAASCKELNDHMMSSRCLTDLVLRYEEVFAVATDMMQTCKFTHLEFGDPVPYTDIGRDKDGYGSYHSYVEDCIATVAKDQRRKLKGWVTCHSVKDVSIAHCKVADGIPLKLWRASTDIPVVPQALLRKLWDERYMWDGNIVNARHIATLDPQTEIYQYVTSSIPPEAHRDHCVLRAWRHDPINNTYSIITTSVSHPNATLLGGVRCIELASRYWIEETNDGCSHLTHYYRVDLRGRSPDFYNHSFGHYLGSSLSNLRNSFKRSIELECIETPV